jgi:hypothetical protein
MLRDSAERFGTPEQQLCKAVSQDARMHATNGWCGQTLILESCLGPTEGTFETAPGVEEMLGNTPPEWGVSIHIWQPNPKAKGFPVENRHEPGIIVEPPHSHPFDFISMVVTGEMHQSTYTPCELDS